MNTRRFRTGAIAVAMVLAAGCAAGDGDDDAGAAELPTLQSGASDDEAADESTSESDDSGGGGARGSDEEVDPEIAMAEYEQCMADQGIDLDFGEAVDGAVVEEFEIDEDAADGGADAAIAIDDLDEFEAAAGECDQILEEAFGEFELTPEEEAEFADQMLELERCLSDEGFDIDMSGNAFELDEDIDFEAFEEAMRTCEPDTQFGGSVDAEEDGP